MLKNLERFDGKDRSKYLEWISNVEVIAQHSKTSFRELICQSMSPSLLHIFSSISAFASDQDIKEILLANYSDIPSMAEAVGQITQHTDATRGTVSDIQCKISTDYTK